MIRNLHLNNKQRLAWLSVVVMLGVWVNALVLFVCPHMLGGSCTREILPPNDHCSAMKNRSKSNHHRPPLSSALTTSSGECSRCIMQGADGLAPTVVAGTQNIADEKNLQLSVLSTPIKLPAMRRSSLDLRDHGPPGHSAKIHVLINTYRI